MHTCVYVLSMYVICTWGCGKWMHMYGMCICAMENMVNGCVCGMCVWQMGMYVGNVGCVVYDVCV